MLRNVTLLLLAIAHISCQVTKNVRQDVRKFPDGFLFGSATASYQIEGAWDEDGKTASIWDELTHNDPCAIRDCSNGDIADDSYHLYKRDVEIMRELGLDFYRFSISWPRLLPSSFPDNINQAAVDYYNNIINEMLKYNIQPMVTLYHWDLPQKLQDLGGWANPNIVDWFGDYARVAFQMFGDRVQYWMTINEPYQICYEGYGDDYKAPRVNIKGIADYMCAKNLLLAHSKAYHIYDQEFRPSQGGSIFIVYSATWHEPATDSENDIQAAEEANQFTWGVYVHPIFGSGDYPPIVKERIARKSAQQGFSRSRLLELSPEEVEYIRGTSDLFALNHYTTRLTYRNESVPGSFEIPSFEDDMEVIRYFLDEWQIGESTMVKSVPWGFYKLLTKIREDYNNPTIIITENGMSTSAGLVDEDRVINYKRYLNALLDAIEDGSDIRAYTAWSMLDNFEWRFGYTERFGLYEVDYESPERTRTPRKSAFLYKEILRTRTLDMNYEPDTDVMVIDVGH
ncbi:myrosinase 1-like [Plodia interpunctella]|uniref:myrosinase 1-like n=1 Tax=Plodia interpunctella TaxID=58824 RepID=UPI0023683B6E|nr:myrosinase 1-like [Plodia interpunctella]